MIIFKIIKLTISGFLTCFLLSSLVSATIIWGPRPRVCVIHVKDCNSATEICGRWSNTNLCQRFANRCYLDIENCNHATQYYGVEDKFCKDIPLNTRHQCKGLPVANENPSNNQHNPWGGRWWLKNNNNNNNVFIVPA